MFDPTIKGPGTLVAHADVAAKEIPEFVEDVRRFIASMPAQSVAANTVQVQPGGKTFSTITDAMNSINDASQRKQYLVSVGPGTYNEVVTCKPWVFIQGAGVNETTVTASGTENQVDKGTVRGASNAAVQNMTIISVGSTFGAWTTAVNCDSAQNFDVENCALQANDTTGNNGANLVAFAADYSVVGGGSQVHMAYCTVNANGGVQPIGVMASDHSYVDVTDTKIIAHNANTAWGGAAFAGSMLNLFNCVVQGTTSLALPDTGAKITARDCTLIGPYDSGVVIIND